jgi:hypothetical protein
MFRATARRCVLAGAAALTVSAIGASSAHAIDVSIFGDYGHVEFEDYGEVLTASDDWPDGRGVRAYLNWAGGNSASALDEGFDTDRAHRNLDIPEGTKVTLTMCYTKNGLDVACSDFKVGTA